MKQPRQKSFEQRLKEAAKKVAAHRGHPVEVAPLDLSRSFCVQCQREVLPEYRWVGAPLLLHVPVTLVVLGAGPFIALVLLAALLPLGVCFLAFGGPVWAVAVYACFKVLGQYRPPAWRCPHCSNEVEGPAK